MMKIYATLAACFCTIALMASPEKLAPFHTIVAGPHVELQLTPGLEEDISIKAYDVDVDKVIVEVKGKTLHVYLENAKNIEKVNRYREGRNKWTEPMYKDAKVVAKVTYRNLKKLVTKGNQDIKVDGTVGGTKFKYKSFGEQKVQFETVETQNFRAKLYGSTRLSIQNGYADLQRYKLYGEHDINTSNVKTDKVKASNFGEVELEVDTKLVALTSFGTADIKSKSGARVRKGIVIGETRIR